MSAIEDLAAKLNMDPVDFLLKNKALLGVRQDIYRDELMIAAEKIGWKKNWHPRGDKTPGAIKRGLGVSLDIFKFKGEAVICSRSLESRDWVRIFAALVCL